MIKKINPYFNKRHDGGWTFQCPHEPNKAVMVTIIGKGEIVLCFKCAQKISEEFVGNAEWAE